ncbi:YcaO-like family protein [Haloimpatiens massiliensis]|uniref:YcaO-like family protein n=1 Tax=Haloimpatiens massiliensis TaxID=1658110 RepID=UPI000C82C907|nr:YcaO-like family protein [Haloimpatiens massiliensis]
MNYINTTKYKDELPINTIDKIRNLLYSAGLSTIETNWNNSIKGFYSVSLTVKGTNLSTNGKGTTSLYALASAYAELMERLQNQSFFKLSVDLSPQALNYRGFYYAPDEKYIKITDMINSQEDWVQTQMSQLNPDIDKFKLMNKWKAISYEDISCDFVALPYINLTNSKLSYIPIKMISKMYMSNGMCAGNTIEEALVQGLSEIFERFVNKEIILNKITPPTISNKYISKFPKIEAMINRIKSNGNYDIIVKDCSLGKFYPVVGIIFINRDDQSYFVKFGAHPILEIALERTLTELLQGQDIKNMNGLKEFAYKNTINSEKNNLIGILVNGSGFYPTEFFSKNFSYKFSEFEDLRDCSNKEMLNYLICLLKKENYDVFVRDVSYLGFPSYHIIVPGFSEIEKIDDIESIEEYSDFVRIKKCIRNLDTLSNEETLQFLNIMKYRKIKGLAPITEFLNIYTKNTFSWYYSSIDLFTAAVYYKLGDFKNAYETFNTFLKYIPFNPLNKKIYTYYKCVRDYIGTKIDNLNEKESIKMLNSFYPLNMINKVINQFRNPQQIFSIFGQLRCWNCEICDFKASCSYNTTEKVYKVLKYNYDLNRIDQYRIKNLLSL